MEPEYKVTYFFPDKSFKKVVVRATEILSGKKIKTDLDLFNHGDLAILAFITDYYNFVVKYRRRPRIKLY